MRTDWNHFKCPWLEPVFRSIFLIFWGYFFKKESYHVLQGFIEFLFSKFYRVLPSRTGFNRTVKGASQNVKQQKKIEKNKKEIKETQKETRLTSVDQCGHVMWNAPGPRFRFIPQPPSGNQENHFLFPPIKTKPPPVSPENKTKNPTIKKKQKSPIAF